MTLSKLTKIDAQGEIALLEKSIGHSYQSIVMTLVINVPSTLLWTVNYECRGKFICYSMGLTGKLQCVCGGKIELVQVCMHDIYLFSYSYINLETGIEKLMLAVPDPQNVLKP